MPLYFPPVNARRPYLFVDGANAQRTVADFVERYWPGEIAELGWGLIAAEFQKVFVYDALPVRRDDEDEQAFAAKFSAARERLERISAANDTHVRTGLTRAEGRRGQLRQKGVDIQLAVDALSMAHRGAFTEVVIWTSDLDFLPLFEELVLMGVTVTLWYPPDITTAALRASADRTVPLMPTGLYRILSNEFKEDHPLPGATITAAPFWGGNVPARWDTPEYGSGYVAVDGAQIYAVWRDYQMNGALQISGPNLHHIITLAADQYNAIVPPGAIPAIEEIVRQQRT